MKSYGLKFDMNAGMQKKWDEIGLYNDAVDMTFHLILSLK